MPHAFRLWLSVVSRLTLLAVLLRAQDAVARPWPDSFSARLGLHLDK